VLTRPLAYKGPADHLSQHFDLPLLYKGMQILLDELLMDWQYLGDDALITAVFLQQGQLLKTQLVWPLANLEDSGHCDCQNRSDAGHDKSDKTASLCEHLAALAIESKMRLERLPQPIKQQQHFTNEIDYLSHWLQAQTFDPFPNMARHRVIYLLDGDASGYTLSVHKAYLTQQNEYQRKGELELSILSKGKLPKFVSLTDQQIIGQINQLMQTDVGTVVDQQKMNLSFPPCQPLLELLVQSGRCFWRTCHRQPLSWQFEAQVESEWWPIGQHCYLDKARSRIVDTGASLEPEVARLIKATQRSPLPTVIPCLTIISEQVYFSWQKNNPQKMLELDIARVTFECDGVRFRLAQFLKWISLYRHQISNLFIEQVATAIHQLEWLPSLASRFESPIWQKLDIADRYLEGDFSHWFVLFRGLQNEGWRIRFDSRFRLNQKLVKEWYSQVSQSHTAGIQTVQADPSDKPTYKGLLTDEQPDWFELELGVIVEGQSINILPYIVKALHRGQWSDSDFEQTVAINLDDGTRIQLDGQRVKNILDNLVELVEKKPLTQQKTLKLPANQFARLLSLETQLDKKTDWQNLDWLRQKVHRLQRLQRPDHTAPPENLQAQLRDYQQQGLNWLQLLRQENLAGILADDMGLGKTVQTLAHILLEKSSGRQRTPSMVVAPTSLLGNWAAEAARFTPDLKVVQWSGTRRHQLQAQLEEADLVITSYGLLLRDAALLNSLKLYLLILDEAQTIKNARSRIARLTYAMAAKHRLCLTGTPLENHLGELWSLFHFLMPGFLGEEAQFKRLFRLPIEKENDSQRQKALSQRVAPFMLRRTKATVATDLPAKTEIDEFVELTQEQADLYESVRLSMMDEVQRALSATGAGRNQLLIGNALLRLRQVCCHPNLVSGNLEKSRADQSAKLNWLQTVLPEMVENGQRILVFSSFTRMLDIIGTLLEQLAIPYLQLTGKSRNRSRLVAEFQAGEIPVFLISLKAGGAGLNLTRADTVIHFDPWWNPAAENQASDRAHRIGQDKPVFVYKLLSKGTVEERIQRMQAKKAQLADHLYQMQKHQNPLSQPDWEVLLAPLEAE